MTIDAILWDYDGTLVNSALKNICITKRILAQVAPHLSGDKLPLCLRNAQAYHRANHKARNWKELYRKHIGLSPEETETAGALWTQFQLRDSTPVKLFDGILEMLAQLGHLRHGICSQNASASIQRVLKENGLGQCFETVIGYDDIPTEEQKPMATGGLKCLSFMFKIFEPRIVVYVGDHEADVRFARNMETALAGKTRVISVAAAYSGADPRKWQAHPDYIIERPAALVKLLQTL